MTLSVSIRHAFGDFTLDAAFEAPEGVTALFGSSGSGKTTLVNAMAGCCATPTPACACRRTSDGSDTCSRRPACSRI